MFDPEKFVRDVNSRKFLSDETLKMPTNKVPTNNLQKLAFDKKIVNIVLDIKL